MIGSPLAGASATVDEARSPRRRRVLVKVGGATLEDSAQRQALAEDLAAIGDEVDLVVVHGGGPQASALGQRLGIEPVFRAGRRVTDLATLEVVALALVGGVGSELLAALLAAGVRAVSTPVASGRLLRAQRRPKRVVAGEAEPIDFGEVADPGAVDGRLCEALWAGGFVPVLSSLCVDDGGARLNLNADSAARALALGLSVDDVIAVADVPGVFGELGRTETHRAALTPSEARAMIASGAVKGGMIAKLEELVALVEGGVDACWIVGAAEQRPITRALRGEPGLRTRIGMRAEAP